MSADCTIDVRDLPILEVGLTPATGHALWHRGLTSAGMVADRTAEEIKSLPRPSMVKTGIGEKRIQEIRQVLAVHGLALKGEKPGAPAQYTPRGSKLLADMERIPLGELPLSDEMRWLLEINGIQNSAQALLGYAHELANKVEFVSADMGLLVPIMIGEEMYRFRVWRPKPRTTMTLQQMLESSDRMGLYWPHPEALEALKQSRLPGLATARIKHLLAPRGAELRILDTTVPGGEIREDDSKRVFDGRDWFLFEEHSHA